MSSIDIVINCISLGCATFHGIWSSTLFSEINYLPNPRNEAVENDLIVDNRCFIELGLDPTTLDNGLLEEVVNVAKKFSNRCDLKRIPCVSAWTSTQAKAINKS